jgi:exonuclease III
MDVLVNNLPNDDINVNKNNDGNTSTNIESTKGSMYRNHAHAATNTSITNQANNLKIFHQNIRGLSNKTDEFLITLSSHSPHVICLTEHHLRINAIHSTYLDQYTVGAYFCRKTYKQGGVAVYVIKDIPYTSIDLDQFISEKDTEICALKLQTLSKSFIVLCIYRSPSGDFTYFLIQLECILDTLFKLSTNVIICGDLNTNLLDSNSRNLFLQSLLASYNLFNTVKYPTRSGNNSYSLIDNTYIDTNIFTFTVYPLVNGLSYHDGQIIHLSSIYYPNHEQSLSYIRKFDNTAIQKFTDLLSYENWDDVFQGNDVNEIFNNFHNTYLRIFHTTFPIKKFMTFPKLNHGLLMKLKPPVPTKETFM